MPEGARRYGPSVALITAGGTVLASGEITGWVLVVVGIYWARWNPGGVTG
jgi:hypothetical protein